jgi:endonuclease/exonuclease/phosphatase (EEP) superfamily protein YafD
LFNTVVAGARLYLGGLLGWALLRLLFLDRWWWLFGLNTFALYLFAPLPLVLIVAAWTRKRELWAGGALALAVGAGLFGPTLVGAPSAVEASAPTLTVMTYNALGTHEHPEEVLAVLEGGDADLVAIQELNGPTAALIEGELGEEYPHRVLDPRPGVSGMGILSRHPLTSTGETLPGRWIGTPQVLEMGFAGTTVTIVHAHPVPTHPGPPAYVRQTIEAREAQARAVDDFVAAHPGPLLAPGDFNTTAQSRAYAILTRRLEDAWVEAGWGPGHTWPGILPLRWLVRIDYVLHSREWRALDARIGPWDGASDHRPVIATLVLTRE